MINKLVEEGNKAPVSGGMATAQQKIEKQARQLAYDTRYQVKKEVGSKKVDPASMKRLLLQRLQKSNAAPNIKMRAKQMLIGEEYISDSKHLAVNSVASALYKVFIEDKKVDENIELEYLKELDENPDKKYKIRVTDKKSGNSYVRYATREKITQLRSNPNIQSVELTEYGDPRESERKSGKQTAAAKAGKDYDGDGKVESGAKEYRGAVHNAIQRRKGGTPDGQDTSSVKESKDLPGNQDVLDVAEPKGKLTSADFKKLRSKKGVREEFISDSADKDSNEKKITGLKSGETNRVIVFPNDKTVDRQSSGPRNVYAHTEVEGEVIAETGYSKFLNMVNEKMNLAKADMGAVIGDFEASDAPQFKGKSKKKRREMAIAAKLTAERGGKKLGEEASCGMGEKSKSKKKGDDEEDYRAQYAKGAKVKNTLRSMGLKMSYEPEGEVLDERRREDKGKPRRPRNRAVEMVRGMNKEGMMTRSGKTIAQHERERGVPESDRPQRPEQTTADRLAAKKQRAAAQVAAAKRSREEEDRRRRLS